MRRGRGCRYIIKLIKKGHTHAYMISNQIEPNIEMTARL